MNSPVVQRWRERRDSYRPAGEVIQTAAYEVAPLEERAAKAFVVAHHYSGSYPAARFRFGLHRRGALVGVAVFSHPCRNEVLTRVFPGDARESVELGRFVLLDDVPGNGETWFLARAFELLRGEGLRGIVSFSDPMARADAAGRVLTPGHIGTIYQAHNAVYLGQARAGALRLLPNGRALHNRAIAKIRQQEVGWRYAVAQLVAAGAPAFDGDVRGWLERALATCVRVVRHPGNHRYAWALDRFTRRVLPASLPYPKFDAQRAA